MGFEPDFGESPRKPSPGELRQHWADLASMAARLYFNLELSPKEREAILTLMGTVHRFLKSAKE
jgi:hypothetical protein